MKKSIAVLVILALLSTLLAGCSGNYSGASKVKTINIKLTEEEYAFGVDKNQPELLAQVNAFIEQIRADGTFEEICSKYFAGGEPAPVASAAVDAGKDQLVVATNAMFEPFEYVIGDKFYGIDMEIAAALAEYLGKELVIIDMDFDAVCLSVSQGKCDIAMAGLTRSEERMAHVTFTAPYYQAAQILMVREDDTTFDGCTTAAEVEEVLRSLRPSDKFGVQAGTTGQYYLEGDAQRGFAGFDVICMGYQAAALAVHDLLNGNTRGVIIDEAPARFIAAAYNQR